MTDLWTSALKVELSPAPAVELRHLTSRPQAEDSHISASEECAGSKWNKINRGKLLRGSIFTERQSLPFQGFNFANMCNNAHYASYNSTSTCTYCTCLITLTLQLIFCENHKIGPLKISRYTIFFTVHAYPHK